MDKLFQRIDAEFRAAAETIGKGIMEGLQHTQDATKRAWSQALDPGKTGRLDAERLRNSMLYESAAQFAALTVDAQMLQRLIEIRVGPVLKKV